MTEKFVSAASLMAQVLGAPEHPFAVIPHPISSATTEQLAEAARRAAATCAEILAPATPPPS